MPTTTQPKLYTVSGFIYDEHNSPLGNNTIKLYEVDFRSRKDLGNAKTDNKGFYSINFKEEAATNPEYKAPDVLIVVQGTSSRMAVLGESPIYFNIQQETTINYTIGGKVILCENEFDALVKIITLIIKPSGISIGKLMEDDKNKDISFLAGETGVDAQYIIFLNTAFALENTKINPAIFYGLYRMGFPLELNELLTINAESIKKALIQAIEENIISSRWLKELDKTIIAFNNLSVQQITEGKDERAVRFKKLFDPSFTKKQEQIFVSTYFRHENEPEKFWENLKGKAGFNDSAIKKAKKLLGFNMLSGDQPELANYLLNTQTSDSDLKEMSSYAKFSKTEWKNIIKAAKFNSFPAWVKGETKAEKTEHYAAELEQLHKQLYPTAFFAARMKQDGHSSFALKTKLDAFFNKNPNFELDTKDIHKQLAAANFRNAADKKALTKELKTINRLYKLTDDYKQVNALHAKQLFSSADIISKYGREQFINQFTETMGGAEPAKTIYKKVMSVNNKTTALITAFKMKHDVDVYAINGDSKAKEENAEFWEGYYEMFADGELCECEHCQSVYSPSAYFVDMLAFIRRENDQAYDELIRRRPDLEYILLTCKNTNTPLPYIDLVNELLEKEVIALDISDEEELVALKKHSFQTEGTAAELLAMPEHINNGAYEFLHTVEGDSVFSEKLPLDLPLEEIRLYTEKLGWKRYELINAFYGNNAPGRMNDEKLAAELFGISTAELKIITGETVIAVTLPLNAGGNCVIKELLEKTKLTYVELLQLLETYFLNPGTNGEREISITQESQEELLTCNLDKLLLSGGNIEWLNKTIRFVRLWKKTGWDIFDFDRILTALKPDDISIDEWDLSNELLISLANIENARLALNITLKQSSALFNTIDTALYLDHTKEGQPVLPSLYEDIFKNIAVNDASSLCAVMCITSEELVIFENTTDYSLPNLSKIYRTVLLARTLGISIIDLKKLVKLTGKDVVNGIWQPQQLCEFLEDWKLFKSVGIKAEEFEDYFIVESDIEYTIPVDDVLLKQTADCIIDLTSIKYDNTITEVERKERLSVSVNDFLDKLEGNTPLKNSLAAIFTNPADSALKTVIEKFFGEENRETINQLAPDEIIKQIEALQKSLIEYASLVLKKSNPEYSIPVNYSLLKQTSDCIDKLTEIKNNSTFIEEERTLQSGAIIIVFLDELSENPLLMESLNATLTNPIDTALKTVIENFIGEENKEEIRTLSVVEKIIRIETLQKSLIEYARVVLEKAPLIFDKLKFSTEEILWMKDNKVDLGIDLIWNESIDFENDDLFDAFKKLYWLSVMAKGRKNIWIDIPDTVLENGLNAKAVLFEKCNTLYGVTKSSLEFLCGPEDDLANKGKLNFTFPEHYISAENIITVLKCCGIIERLGGNAEQLQALLNTDVSPESAPATVLAIQNLLRSKYSSKEWPSIKKPISDILRTRKRDALTAWLTTGTNEDSWLSSNDIYEYLLIDTEMAACMVTSRIKQGISSIQLFIDRCLMNLETGITLTKDFAEQWHSWRKQYRVWEANRKIFLYPENWIEPDLRDDKSPFFKELESQLKQNEVTEDTAKEALITYLQKLDTVANLEMVGLFNDEETKIVHVFGRTQNIPHQYFYRKQENKVWTAWEKVDLDIEGDHILPVVWNGRLMLFWGIFAEKEEREGGFKVPGEGDVIEVPETYFELKLSWSEYKNGKWMAKKLSKEHVKLSRKVIVHDHRNGENKTYAVYLKKEECSLASSVGIAGLSINILLRKYGFVNRRYFYARFHFEFCHSSPVLKDIQTSIPSRYIQNSSGTRIDIMTISEWNKDSFNLFDKGIYRVDMPGNSDPVKSEIILNSTPGDFRLLPNHHQIERGKKDLFFYSNSENNFFTTSTERFKPQVQGMVDINSSLEVLARKFGDIQSENHSLSSTKNKSGITTSIPDLYSPDIKSVKEVDNNEIGVYENFQEKKYSFQTFYHPYACDYIKTLYIKGIESLYTKEVQNSIPKYIFTETDYNPTKLVQLPYPKEEVDFSYTGSYSSYNWELFFHTPLLIATRLTQNQKFEEARKWFHYIFNPIMPANEDLEDGSSARRFWITKPFRIEIDQQLMSLEDLLNLNENADDLEIQLSKWEDNPFNPHAVARLRISAYMRNTVLKYIDNLIQWGDQLFKRDTIESINEATLLYILASNILGKKQAIVPPRAKSDDHSFYDIKDKLDRFSNVKADIESFIHPSSGVDGISIPYFCLPKNDYLLKYWDTVADRLFKIRHCMNIQGIVRQLPLFEPPIDPGLLVRATAAGVDLNTILNDMDAPLSHYRFQVMLQLANEICNDVKMLGGSLLSALENKDGEEMALLRSAHELTMLEMIKDIKEKQRDEAKENLKGIDNSKRVIEIRRDYFKNKDFINVYEKLQVTSLGASGIFQGLAAGFEAYGGLLLATPDIMIGPFSSGFTTGGSYYGAAARANASIFGLYASTSNTIGAIASAMGNFHQRKDDWDFQGKSAELELKQIDKQIIAAEIRLAIAEKELENHELQMEQSKEVDDYMRSKFTNAELYDWMVGQLSTVYFQSYQLAYATAKKAEKCMQHELGLEATNYIQFGYWDSLKKGLLSGDKLQFDLRRLENAYMGENRREYEIIKHVSIMMLDPLAIIKLRTTGSCEFEIPEVLYDMDHPGQYFRRLKSVSVSLPCIAGPFTSVSAKLSLLNNRYRKNTNVLGNNSDNYPEDIATGDNRFVSNRGSIQSIATSNAQNDSGVFELNFRDERYLPFENTGAISSWSLELPSEVRQFDYNTISDVIVHVKYTAREGGSDLKSAANATLKNQLNAIRENLNPNGLNIGINMKQDLSNEWHLLKNNGTLDLKIDKSRLPYLVQSFDNVKIESVMFVAKIKDNPNEFVINVNGAVTKLEWIDELKLFGENNSDIHLDTLFNLSFSNADDKEKLEELLLVVKYVF